MKATRGMLSIHSLHVGNNSDVSIIPQVIYSGAKSQSCTVFMMQKNISVSFCIIKVCLLIFS